MGEWTNGSPASLLGWKVPTSRLCEAPDPAQVAGEQQPAVRKAASKEQPWIADTIKKTAWGHHACGTCKMGTKDNADTVVDGNFRVGSTTNLHVVDASPDKQLPALARIGQL